MHDGYGPCPECGSPWGQGSSDGTLSTLMGVYSFREDKTTGWMCPRCGTFFPRVDVEFNGRVIGETEAPVPPVREPPDDHG